MAALILPHSFVLADLFDVEAMTLDIPDHVLETEPHLQPFTCPGCDGAGWLRVLGSAWGRAVIQAGRSDLNYSCRCCLCCYGKREVLVMVAGLEPQVFNYPDRLAAGRVRESKVRIARLFIERPPGPAHPSAARALALGVG